MALGVCEGCRRFARGNACPFCGARVGAPMPIPRGRRNRLGRLAASAITLAGCSSLHPVYGGPGVGDSGPEEDAQPIAADAAYGLIPFDAQFDTGADMGADAGADANEEGDASDGSEGG